MLVAFVVVMDLMIKVVDVLSQPLQVVMKLVDQL